MKKLFLFTVFISGTFLLNGCDLSSLETTSANNVSIEASLEAETSTITNTNIKSISFIRSGDQTVTVGKSTSESYLSVKVKDKKNFSPSDVEFVSENPEIATIEFTHDALTTCLYYVITGVTPGETYVYAKTQDGGVVSERLKVVVEGYEVEESNISNETPAPANIDSADSSIFVTTLNTSLGNELVFVEDFVPSDKNSDHYRTEFRLNGFKDAEGKSYNYGDATVDIIICKPSFTGRISMRIYMEGASLDQCKRMIQYAAPLMDSTVTDSDIQDTINYINEEKTANGYYFSKLGLLLLGSDNQGYSFMLKKE